MVICSNCEEKRQRFIAYNVLSRCAQAARSPTRRVKLYRGHRFKVIAVKNNVEKSVLNKGVKGVRFDATTLARDAASNPLKISASEVSIEEVTESGGFDKISLLWSFADIIKSYIWADDWQSRLLVMLVTFVLYTLLKLFLGRLSVIILVVCAFAVIRNANSTKNHSAAQARGSARSWWEELVREVRELFHAGEVLIKGNPREGQALIKDLSRMRQELYNTTNVPEYDESEFKDEFWHSAKPRRRKMHVRIKRALDEPGVIIR